MGKQLTLILGGARSGKSAHAERLAQTRGQQVVYVATAEARDAEMAMRIATHRAQRPSDRHTVEAPRVTGAAIRAAVAEIAEVDLVLVDCLTLLASNVIAGSGENVPAEQADAALQHEVGELLAVYADGTAEWIIISNEVGLGIVPAYPLGRVYRDALGRANQRLAAVADEVLFMVAGLAMVVKSGRVNW